VSSDLLVLGHVPWTPIGQACGAVPGVRLGAAGELAGHRAASRKPTGIVVGPGDDPQRSARVAAAVGVPVLIEPVGALTAADITELLATAEMSGASLFAGFRRRFEPDVRWSRGTVAAGGIGLTWGVHAEVLRSRAADPVTEALDLLDTLSLISGCVPTSISRFDRGRGAPVVLNVLLDHGTSGHVVVRAAEGELPSGPELGTFRVMGSHGTVAGDLDLPGQTLTIDGSVSHERVGADGATRLVAAFLAIAAGAPGPRPVELRGAIRDIGLLATVSRRGRGSR